MKFKKKLALVNICDIYYWYNEQYKNSTSSIKDAALSNEVIPQISIIAYIKHVSTILGGDIKLLLTSSVILFCKIKLNIILTKYNFHIVFFFSYLYAQYFLYDSHHTYRMELIASGIEYTKTSRVVNNIKKNIYHSPDFIENGTLYFETLNYSIFFDENDIINIINYINEFNNINKKILTGENLI
jgi:hypothetical protein